jgi:sulfoxide reductase catalytic subunit YedY
LLFIVVHVTLIVMTGFVRNMNHIVMGTDDQNRLGMILGFAGIGVVVLSWIAAHYVSWFYPRFPQHAQKFITYPLLLTTLNRLTPISITPSRTSLRVSGRTARCRIREDWKQLAKGGFQAVQAQGGWPCRQPGRAFSRGHREAGQGRDITMHHCIQGWTGIAKWGGLPMKSLVELVRPKPNAKVVAFFSFGGSLYGGPYYDTQSIDNVLKAECLLASEMNGKRPHRGIWSPIAAAGRKSAWLQDGQVD